MQPLWIFSATDNSIDIVGGFIYAAALYLSFKYYIRNNLNHHGKILYIMIGLISTLHLVQIFLQVFGMGPNLYTFRLWDIINYITAMTFLMAVERIYRKEKKH